MRNIYYMLNKIAEFFWSFVLGLHGQLDNSRWYNVDYILYFIRYRYQRLRLFMLIEPIKDSLLFEAMQSSPRKLKLRNVLKAKTLAGLKKFGYELC